MKRGTVVLVTVISALSLSACGGGDEGNETTSPSEWADSLCTDLGQWKSSIESTAASFAGANLSQEQVQNAVNDASNATEALVGQLQDLGRPDAEGGQEAQDSLNQLSEELQTGIGEAERAAAGVSSPADAAQAASSIRSTFTTMGNQLTSTFTSLEQPQGELKSALEQSAACDDLKSS
jgi:hypothetical protein